MNIADSKKTKSKSNLTQIKSKTTLQSPKILEIDIVKKEPKKILNEQTTKYNENENKDNEEIINSNDYKNFLADRKKKLEITLSSLKITDDTQQKKISLFVSENENLIMNFPADDKFTFDRTKNENLLQTNLNEITNNRKYGYSQTPYVKKPLNTPILAKNNEKKLETTAIRKIETQKILTKIDILENYTLGKVIGQGSYATVRYAKEKDNDQKFAVKIYENYRLVDPQKKKNLQREISILEKLNHPNVISLFKTIKTNSSVNLILEFIGTTSLHTYLKSKIDKILPDNEIRYVFRQIVEGINYCHSKNIVHRDIKLENILVDENRRIKIIDFGFSIQVSLDTKLSIYCGTPSYMAPEILQKKEYFGPPVDVWALGVVLFVMACGNFPFKNNEKESAKGNLKFSFEIPNKINSGIKNLIGKIFKVNPLERLTSEEILYDEWLMKSEENN